MAVRTYVAALVCGAIGFAAAVGVGACGEDRGDVTIQEGTGTAGTGTTGTGRVATETTGTAGTTTSP